MRFFGKNNDGQIGNFVKKVMGDLACDTKLYSQFLVAIDKRGHLVIDSQYSLIEWSEARQAIIVLFRDRDCSIRHIDENYRVHKQYIGRKGFRICVNDWDNLELCLYRNVNLFDSRILNSSNFPQEMKGMWADYLSYI